MPSRIKKDIHAENHTKSTGRYLGEFVYGGIDGTVTTFAVVSGAEGALLSPAVVIAYLVGFVFRQIVTL